MNITGPLCSIFIIVVLNGRTSVPLLYNLVNGRSSATFSETRS